MMKKERLLSYSAFLYAFLLPISTKLGNITFGLFLFIALFNINYKKSNIDGVLNISKYSTAIFFVAYLFGFVISGDLSIGIDQFGKKIFYLLTPIIVSLLSMDDIHKTLKNSLKGLFYGCLGCSIILIFHNFYEYYLTRQFFYLDKDIFNFYYTGYNFTRILDIHPTYLGSYFILALVYSIDFLFKKTENFFNGIFLIIVLFLYITTIVFLNSRIIYGLSFLILVSFSIRYGLALYIKNKSLFIIFFSIPFLIVVVAFNLLGESYLSGRITKELAWDLSGEVGTEYNYNIKGDSRLARWKAGLEVIMKKPLSGYGLHNEKQALEKEFEIRSMKHSIKNRYDAHNQFISFFIQFGIVGLVLVIFFVSNFYFAVKSNDIFYFLFVFTVITICFFENYLNMNAGILFVAFFSSLFLAKEKVSKS